MQKKKRGLYKWENQNREQSDFPEERGTILQRSTHNILHYIGLDWFKLLPWKLFAPPNSTVEELLSLPPSHQPINLKVVEAESLASSYLNGE